MGRNVGARFNRAKPGEASFKRSKYNATKTVIDGITFDSKKEAARWVELKQREAAGEISSLARQVKFPFAVDRVKICSYVCDFVYYDLKEKKRIHEDVKGFRTPVYKLKLKMLHAFYPFVILREV